ncbi:MAG: glucans biosynthesis glucosyltransferase MdoH [Flavobacteriaceae bacterium]
MDRVIRLDTRSEGGLLPPQAPLAMPDQRLDRWRAGRVRLSGRQTAWWRVALVALTAIVTVVGIHQMALVVSIGGTTLLEGVFVVLFALTFAWVAFAAVAAIIGTAATAIEPDDPVEGRAPDAGGRIALLMPVYNEDSIQVCAGLQAMGEGLARIGAARRFEIFVLSDSNNADVLVQEAASVARLADALAGTMPVWYRHRARNIAKKAGNIRDFIERWGGRYEAMVVLDADSLMAPETMAEMVRRMDADPRLGILQTVPALAGGRSLFARLQQFAGALYGPVVARGYAVWQGNDGNYWGHNAIIRCLAFSESCGLPELAGRKPFGGHVMSHDFVEAALIRRAGWKVAMADDLEGSWEAAPPSLSDIAIRDRRWAQGNIQHSKIIGAAGLHPASRAHFAIGIASYATAVLWLALIVVGALLAAQAILVRPEYFSEGFQLFPTWPRFDSERMLAVFVASMAVLFLPKFIGYAEAVADSDRRRAFGGGVRLTAGFVAEIVLSALYAPVLMLIQCRHIWDILRGRDSGWNAQRRDDGETAWEAAFAQHRMHMLAGLAMLFAALMLSPPLAAWLAPVIAGLVLAVPLARWSGSRRLGEALARIGLLVIPDETRVPPIAAERARIAEDYRPIAGNPLVALATDEALRLRHFGLRGRPAPMRRGDPDAPRLTAARKLAEARSMDEACSWLTPEERRAIVCDPGLVDLMRPLALPAPEPEGSVAS